MKFPQVGQCFMVTSNGALKQTSCNKYNKWKIGVILNVEKLQLTVKFFNKRMWRGKVIFAPGIIKILTDEGIRKQEEEK